MKMPIWLGGGVPPAEPPDLVAESKEREEKAAKLVERLFPPKLRPRDPDEF